MLNVECRKGATINTFTLQPAFTIQCTLGYLSLSIHGEVNQSVLENDEWQEGAAGGTVTVSKP